MLLTNCSVVPRSQITGNITEFVRKNPNIRAMYCFPIVVFLFCYGAFELYACHFQLSGHKNAKVLMLNRNIERTHIYGSIPGLIESLPPTGNAYIQLG